MTTDERGMAKASWWELVEHTDTRALYVLTRTGGTIISVCDLNLLAESVVRDEQGSIREDWTQYVYYLSKAQAPWARDQPWRTLDRARRPARFTPPTLAIPVPREGMVPLSRLLCPYCGQKALEGTIRPEGFVYYPVSCRACGQRCEKSDTYEYALLRAGKKRHTAALRGKRR
jgi:hypothetical protein